MSGFVFPLSMPVRLSECVSIFLSVWLRFFTAINESRSASKLRRMSRLIKRIFVLLRLFSDRLSSSMSSAPLSVCVCLSPPLSVYLSLCITSSLSSLSGSVAFALSFYPLLITSFSYSFVPCLNPFAPPPFITIFLLSSFCNINRKELLALNNSSKIASISFTSSLPRINLLLKILFL